jgi:DNA-binding transcriptional MerR regulator
MTRKRNRYTRARDRGRRPKHPAPREGFLVADVARLTNVPVRTLRDYVRRGLLHYSERRGTITRYPRSEVVRLLGALRLKRLNKGTWVEIKRRLDTMSPLDLEQWLVEQGLAPRVATELGIAPLAKVPEPEPSARSMLSIERANAHWQRTELLPGLELLLSVSASPAVKRAAQRIIDEHVAGV